VRCQTPTIFAPGSSAGNSLIPIVARECPIRARRQGQARCAGRYARLDSCARVGPSAAMSFADWPGLAVGPGQQNSWPQGRYTELGDTLRPQSAGAK
jgi:hypothetical protein